MPNPVYRLLTWIFLLLGLASSGALSYWVKFDIATRAYQEFIYDCEEIQLKIAARLTAHEQTLLGGAAQFDASKSVEREEWHTYVEHLRLNEHFNGIQGLGFSLWIPAAQLSAHQASIRAEGFPDYKVRPEGDREFYTSIIFLEPFTDRNLRAFGYDMYSEPVRRVAMERARDENIVALSGRVRLVQETDKNVQAGTLMYVPVYKKGQPIATVEQRRTALLGWVYSPFRMTDLLNNIKLFSQDSDLTQVHLRVYDGQNTHAEQLLYDNNSADHSDTEKTHQRLLVQLKNDFNGTVWTLQFEQVLGTNGLDYSKAWITLGTGVFISLLLFLLSYSYINTRVKATRIAADLTRELQESEGRFRVLADNAPVLIWIIERDKLCSHVNKVWLDFTGRTLEQELGNGWAEGVHTDDLQRCMAVFTSSFDARLPFTTEYRLRRYDGEYRWLLDTGMPRFTDEGAFLGYIGSCIDITERKQTEEAIQKSLSLLHATLESSSDAVLVVDTHNTWILHNQKFVDLWQIPDEIIASNDDNTALSYALSLLEDPDGFLKKVHELYHSPEASSFDILNFKDGKIVERYSIPQRINDKVVGRVWSFRDVTERLRAEYFLRKESEKNQALLRNASDGIHILDTDGNIIEISDSFSNMLGYSREEMIGMNVNQWAVKLPAECIQSVKKQFAKKDSSLFETRHRRKDGTIIDVEISGFPLELDGKSVLFNSSRDITERKRIENALQESQVLLQTAQRAAYLGHYVIDLRDPTAITWTNDALFDEIFGLDEHFIRNFANLSQIIHPDDLWLVEDSFQKAIYSSPEKPADFIEHRIIRPNDGRERWIGKWGYVFFDDQGNPIRQVGMIQDITERKQLEEQVRNNFLYNRNLIEVSLDPLVTISPDGKITDVNKATEKVTGFSREELIDRDFADYFTDPEKARAGYLETFFNGTVTDYPLVIKHRDGHLTDVLYNATVYKNENGDIVGVFAAARDITERKQAELAKEQLQAFYELDLVGLTITSPEKGWIKINNCLCDMLEYSESELRQMTWVELTYPEDLAADIEQFEKLLANEINGYALEKRFVSRTGKIVPTRLVVRCIRKVNGKVDYVMAMVEDISGYKKAEAELRIAATVFEAQEGMLITDANTVILDVNYAFTCITGYSRKEVIGQTPKLLYSGRHDNEFYTAMWQSIHNTGAWQGEIWNRRKNEEIYPEWLTITAVKGDKGIVTHYVSTMTDISERKATEEYINRLAFYDVLTQLPNRRLLQERMKHGIVRFQRTGNEMAVLMMDLDKFKAVNDTLGHAAGDELLQQVAKRIKDRLREVDMVARLGGDEFVVLIEDIKQHENLALIAESIIHTLSQVFTLGADHEVYIGVSIGIAICPEHGNSEEALMDNADIALYHAKAQGRGCFVYFSDALTQKIQEHAIIETRLRHAIEQQELYVFFQPQIDISSNQVVGAEAIVLWYHPTHGYFMPKDFLDLAEKTGLIIDIGEWLLRQTCKLGRQWLDEGLPAVILAVNVSPYQFRHVNVSKLVTQILEETGFPAQYLALEITETGLMENHENAQPILNILYEQGVHLVIDDFGKGFSSLTYLKHFPLDMLKIDKSFIDDLPYSQDDSAITASLIAMAHHLGFKVLAEGVETVPQLTFLRQQGCDKYQGVHSQALPANQFARLLLNLRDA